MLPWLNAHMAALSMTALILGSMIFYAFVVTPLVFAKLPRETASEFLGEAFPVYYLVMGCASGLALLFSAPGGGADPIVLAMVVAGFVVARQVILPRINRHREGRLAGEERSAAAFRRLHRASVLLNLAQMIAVAAVFLRLAART